MSDDTPTTTPRILPDLTAQPEPESSTVDRLGPAPRKARKAKAKAAPAKKAATTKKAAPPAKAGRQKKYSDDMRITLVRKDMPPKRNGRNPYAIYAKVKTVGEFLAAGGFAADLPWDSKNGVIKLG